MLLENRREEPSQRGAMLLSLTSTDNRVEEGGGEEDGGKNPALIRVIGARNNK